MTDAEYEALDLAVARAEIAAGRLEIRITDAGRPTVLNAKGQWEPFCPSVNWSQAGPIIERVGIDLVTGQTSQWVANIGYTISVLAETPLIAAMRAYAASEPHERIASHH